jgi:hypothetical protein
MIIESAAKTEVTPNKEELPKEFFFEELTSTRIGNWLTPEEQRLVRKFADLSKNKGNTRKEREYHTVARGILKTLHALCCDLSVSEHDCKRLRWMIDYAKKAPTLKAVVTVLEDGLDGCSGSTDVVEVRSARDKLEKRVARMQRFTDAGMALYCSIEQPTADEDKTIIIQQFMRAAEGMRGDRVDKIVEKYTEEQPVIQEETVVLGLAEDGTLVVNEV